MSASSGAAGTAASVEGRRPGTHRRGRRQNDPGPHAAVLDVVDRLVDLSERPRLTDHERAPSRWTGIVALLGALSFLVTFLALIQGTSEDSVFG